MVEEDWVREYSSKLNRYKPMGLTGSTQVLREMVDVILRPHSITFEKSW